MRIKNILSSAFIFTTVSIIIAVLAMNSCSHKDSCNIPCYNGTCVNNSCNCSLGYEGDSCSILSTAKFIGSYTALDSCQSNTYGYTVTVAAAVSVVNQLVITNFGEYGSQFTVTADVSGFTFTVPEQIKEGITISGNGVVDTLTKTIAVTYLAKNAQNQTDACSGVWAKQ